MLELSRQQGPRESKLRQSVPLRYLQRAASHTATSSSRWWSSESVAVSANVCQSTASSGVLLPTAYVMLAANNGRRIKVRALIDQASEATLVTERVVQELAASKMTANTLVKGVGGASAGATARCVELAVTTCLEGEQNNVNVTALVMKKVTSRLPSRAMTRAQWPHLEQLPLADPHFDQPGDIDILLGGQRVCRDPDGRCLSWWT